MTADWTDLKAAAQDRANWPMLDSMIVAGHLDEGDRLALGQLYPRCGEWLAEQAALRRSREKVLCVTTSPAPGFADLVDDVLADLGAMLKEKNRAYGNSALAPLRVFSRADSVEQIKVRLDDKLSRLARGAAAGEDVVTDLLGYLVLLKIAERAPAHADRR